VMGEKLEEIFLKINKKEQHLKSDTLKKCSCHEDFFNFTSQEFGSHQIKIEAEGIGIWVDNGDVEGWVHAMQYFEDYPQQAIDMGQRARKLAETRMNSLLFANQVMDIFDSLLAR
ncbi:MAG: glycosyltransferase, partial [Dolichospermum sp.]